MSVPHTVKDSTAASAQARIWDIGTAYLFSQALYVAAKLGIADLLKDGTKTSAELAKATEAHAPSLCRVLRVIEARPVP